MTVSGRGRLRGGGIEQKGKRTHGHEQQCGDCWGGGGRGIKGINGNGKNTIKINLKEKKKTKETKVNIGIQE